MRGRLASALPAAIVLAGIAGWVGTASAQSTGRVVGRVIDAQTGEPLVAAQVMVEGTDLGDFVRDDGSYTIAGVPPGVHRITTEYLGYGRRTQERRIPPGETVTVDFAMEGRAVDADAIVAVVERPPIETPEKFEVAVVVQTLPTHLPDELESPPCSVQIVNRGAYIADGQWQFDRELGEFACGPPIDPCADLRRRIAELERAMAAGSR